MLELISEMTNEEFIYNMEKASYYGEDKYFTLSVEIDPRDIYSRNFKDVRKESINRLVYTTGEWIATPEKEESYLALLQAIKSKIDYTSYSPGDINRRCLAIFGSHNYPLALTKLWDNPPIYNCQPYVYGSYQPAYGPCYASPTPASPIWPSSGCIQPNSYYNPNPFMSSGRDNKDERYHIYKIIIQEKETCCDHLYHNEFEEELSNLPNIDVSEDSLGGYLTYFYKVGVGMGGVINILSEYDLINYAPGLSSDEFDELFNQIVPRFYTTVETEELIKKAQIEIKEHQKRMEMYGN